MVRRFKLILLICLVFGVFLILRFLFPSYNIPTSSMERTLMIGDVIYASKLSYGMHIPFTNKSLPPLQKVARNSTVIFYYPVGDTVIDEMKDVSYYDVVRQKAYELRKAGDSISQPLDKVKQEGYHIHTNSIRHRDIYVKRCVGIPGDKLQIKEGVLYVNGQKSPEPQNILLIYAVTMSDSLPLDESVLLEYGIEKMGKINGHPNIHLLRMSHDALIKFGTLPRVVTIGRYTYPPNTEMYPVPIFFPNNFQYYNWNTDNFGPVTIPQKGMKLSLNDSTLCQYRRLIEVYEGNKLEQKNGKIFVNGTEANEYTCKQDYYWMMGDNRYNAYDSRFWGFVPADHIAARPLFILYSRDQNAQKSMDKIRWSRTLHSIPD